MKIGVAIITHNARHHLPYCLPPLIQSELNPQILVVNSSSSDGTVEMAKKWGVNTLVIPRSQFNHGSTRELARQELKTDIVVMTTPDAYAVDKYVLGKLVQPLMEKKASLAYARQIPHKGAKIWESFPRGFNYPALSQFREIKDVSKYGVYTFFFSDSFGAYLNSALNEIGGFSPILTGEDTVACAQLLLKGHKVAYVAEAEVYHSHHYSLLQEFKRHFDTGLAREEQKNLLSLAGEDSERGRAYVRALLKQVSKENVALIPYAIIQSFSKWMGYQFGRRMTQAPKNLKRIFSAQDFYWV